MSARVTYPTPYPDINAVLDVLLSAARAVLGPQLVGLYLHGSLASGDSEPGRSDVDFLVVTAAELPRETIVALQAMHARISASGLPWATRLEGSYIPQQALRRYDPARAWHPALRVDGSFGLDHHTSDWIIQRHLIREQGLTLAGPKPRTLIDPILPDDLRRATVGILREWWEPQLQDHSRLLSSEYQSYAVLTMCRALYTLERGAVATKSVAARWAQERLGERWAALIARALAWRHGTSLQALDESLDLIRYTLERAQQSE